MVRTAIVCDGKPGGSLEMVRARVPVTVSSLQEPPPTGWDPEVVFLTDWPTAPWERALAGATRLRWLHWGGVGVERLLGPLSSRPDVWVSTSRGAYDQAMAEYAVLLGLAALRELRQTWEHQRARRWVHRPTRRLADAHAVVIGAGSVARAVARAFKGLGAGVTLVGRSGRTDPEFGEVVAVTGLEQTASFADLLVLAVPLTGDTHGLIDRTVLDALKPGAYLINLSRGPVVVESDLVSALTSGQLSGAALDVFDTEPLPVDHPFWTHPGIVVSPHMSAASEGDWERLLGHFVENLDRYLAGSRPAGLVDLAQGFISNDRD